MDEANAIWVTPSGVASYGPHSELPANFGAKARGLLWLPSAWVPPFFTVSPEIYSRYYAAHVADRAALLAELSERFASACALVGLPPESHVLLRSNAVRETIAERGRYASAQTRAHQIASALVTLYESIRAASPSEPVGVIVQRYIAPVTKGHLSNERRVADEYRDALIEFEDTSGTITERRISFRRWRSARQTDEGALACHLPEDLPSVLRNILALAAQRAKRVHFEWVWDGHFVHVVQADLAEEQITGTSPETTLRAHPQVEIDEKSLLQFSAIRAGHVNSVGKMRNHSIYAASDFWQPTFFQLCDSETIGKILRGERDGALESDLRALTVMPLVIRTSYLGGTRVLLPRSHQLGSVEQAMAWLYGDFTRMVREKDIAPTELSLLAHHYIPAKVAAFSTGSAERLEVYVESLWGIPEGLYYYPFDSYTVRTVGANPKALTEKDAQRFEVVKKPRFKSHFVAPDLAGQFVRYSLGQPWDWKRTIEDDSLLRRMALFTRVLAKDEGHPISIMWFVSCSTPQGPIDLVPWYHERSAESRSETTYRRNARDEVIKISTQGDLEKFEGRPLKLRTDNSRMLVELSPADDQAIRNESFASKVGAAAKRHDAVVILNGASLSHIYYVLTRTGAEIVVRNLHDIPTRREMHEKLVRDKIPEKVAAGGETARVANLNREETIAALRIKLVEEAFEVRDASKDTLVEELADVSEVLRALTDAAGYSMAEVEEVRKKKERGRGGFQEGRVLISTDSSREPTLDPSLLSKPSDDAGRVVIADKAPPLERVRPGAADVRDTADFVEFVQSGTVSLTHAEWTIEGQRRTLLPQAFDAHYLTWTVDGQRDGATLKLRVKVRVGSSQLELPLDGPWDGVSESES